jgi:hypothetical protein
MDEFHHKKSSKNDGTGDSRIPAFCSEDMSTITFRQSVIEGKLKKMQNSSSGFHTDCTLHGPASSSKNVVRSTASNGGLPKSIKMIFEANGTVSKAKEWFTDAKHRYEEDIEWHPFQPGCSFDIDTNSQIQGTTGGDSLETNKNAAEQENLELRPTKMVFADVRFTFFGKPNYKPEANKSKKCTKIELVDDDESSLAGNPNCHLHVQCFQALQQKVEAMCADEFEFSNSSSALYSHQLLHAYKPRGILNASLSALIHSCFCGFAMCPTLLFFVLWAYNNVNAYLIHPYWTPAAYVIIYVAIFAGISVAYLLVVYLEFPFIFYGKSLISEDINYFCFKPFIGVWYGT